MNDNNNLENEILQRLTRIETKVDDFGNITDRVSEAYSLSKQNNKRLDKIEGNIQWLWRSIGGAILTGAIAFLFKFFH